jgi:hypothetical protein
MDDDRVRAEFDRIAALARLERQQVIIRMYHEGLAEAWRLVGEAQYDLGRSEEKLGVKE